MSYSTVEPAGSWKKHLLTQKVRIYINILGMGNTGSIFNFFVEFMPKNIYMEENSYSKDVLKGF